VGDHKLSSDLPVIAKAANAFTLLELNAKYNDPKDPEKIYTRSDHYNFAKKGVPVIFFYDGGNADYHRVTDTVDKIDFELMSKRVKLVFYTAWEMANRKEMLVRDKGL
jgi:Zn-dependent M28 family amino/carboxypeptidase